MRITAGTVVLLIVASPFIGYLVYILSGMVSQMRPPEIAVPGPVSGPVSWTHGLLLYLYRVLSDPRAIAFLLGAGLLYKALEEAKA